VLLGTRNIVGILPFFGWCALTKWIDFTLIFQRKDSSMRYCCHLLLTVICFCCVRTNRLYSIFHFLHQTLV